MPKRSVAPIRGPRSRLRLVDAADLSLTLVWRNQDHIRRWFLHSEVLAGAQHRAWFLEYLGRDDDFLFVIEETERLRKPVGQVGLYRIDWGARSAEFGRILIGEPDARGIGLAGEATALLLGFAFGEWGFRSIDLEVFADNERALRVYRRCGFEPTTEEGGLTRMRVTPDQFARSPSRFDGCGTGPGGGPGDDPSDRLAVA